MPVAEWRDTESFAPPEALSACPKCGDIYRGGVHSCSQLTTATDVGSSFGMAPLAAPGHLGTREEIQAELDGVAAAIRRFHIKDPDQVLREASAYTARLTELSVLLHRVESTDRQYTRVRTQQVDRYLNELDRQFKIASRLIEVFRQDLEMSR